MIENQAQFERSVELARGFKDHFEKLASQCREDGLQTTETKRYLDPQVSFNEGIREELDNYAAANDIDLKELGLPPRPTELLAKLVNG